MALETSKLDRYLPLLIFAGALILFSGLLWRLRSAGMVRIDDAYITFRYSENLARGLGFVYNRGEHVLGTTTALFCLLLAGLRVLRAPVPIGADLVSLVSSAGSAALMFMIGREAKSRSLGLMAAFFYVFIPQFWINMATGMETMFTVFLGLLLIRLDQKERPVLSGLAGGALLLTRLDGLALVAAVLLVRFFKSPRRALLCAGVLILTQLPWLVFSTFYFGSALPHSILAKRLIHALPPWMVLAKYAQWFLGLELRNGQLKLASPELLVFSAFAFIGAARSLRRERWALIYTLWIFFSLAGMIPASATPFFWYKIPMLTGYLFLAALGIFLVSGLAARLLAFLGPALNVLIPLALTFWAFTYYSTDFAQSFTAKERVNLRLAKIIEQRSKPGSSVLLGETGMAGYELMDYYILDSAGLVSDNIYRLRLKDRERLLKVSPAYQWDWYGSIGWMKDALAEYRPDFILSDRRYLHIFTLMQDPQFRAQYDLIASEPANKEEIVLLERK